MGTSAAIPAPVFRATCCVTLTMYSRVGRGSSARENVSFETSHYGILRAQKLASQSRSAILDSSDDVSGAAAAGAVLIVVL